MVLQARPVLSRAQQQHRSHAVLLAIASVLLHSSFPATYTRKERLSEQQEPAGRSHMLAGAL